MRAIKIGHKLGDVDLVEYDWFYELQGMVGGYLEQVTPAELGQANIELLANEDGLLEGLENNYNLFPFFFVGTLVAVGSDGETFVDLTNEQIAYMKQWLKNLDNGHLYEVEI